MVIKTPGTRHLLMQGSHEDRHVVCAIADGLDPELFAARANQRAVAWNVRVTDYRKWYHDRRRELGCDFTSDDYATLEKEVYTSPRDFRSISSLFDGGPTTVETVDDDARERNRVRRASWELRSLEGRSVFDPEARGRLADLRSSDPWLYGMLMVPAETLYPMECEPMDLEVHEEILEYP